MSLTLPVSPRSGSDRSFLEHAPRGVYDDQVVSGAEAETAKIESKVERPSITMTVQTLKLGRERFVVLREGPRGRSAQPTEA